MCVRKWAQGEKLLSATRGASGENEFRDVAGYRGRVKREAILEALQLVTTQFMATLPQLELANLGFARFSRLGDVPESRLEWEFPSKSDLWRHEFAPLFRGLTELKREKYRWHQGLLVHLAESRSSSSYLLSCLTGQVLKDGVLSSFTYCIRVTLSLAH